MVKNSTSKKKIIIIGAGIAGLAACNRLVEHGFDAVILEARDRCGGRIWTDHTLGFPLGLGASWIHGTKDNPIAQLANNSHAKMAAVDSNKFVIFDQHGIAIPQKEVDEFKEKFQQFLDAAKKLAFNSKQDISLSAALADILKNHVFSPREHEILKTKFLFFENYIGANYELLSARYWDQEEIWPGDNCFLTSSYQPIVEGLAKNCTIELNTVVKRINVRSRDIEIIAEDAIFNADAVIVTVPLGVLKNNDILFNPPLPDYKLQALQRLEMGLLNITAMKFAKPFWPKEHQAMFFTQFDDSSISVFLNLQHFMSEPVLMGFSGGNRALELEKLTNTQLVEKTMENFKKAFCAELPHLEVCVNTRWSQDPFSHGSYSYLPVGASGNDYEELSKPILDRLFFAGEATSAKHAATTHGAYLSGIREAERILNL